MQRAGSILLCTIDQVQICFYEQNIVINPSHGLTRCSLLTNETQKQMDAHTYIDTRQQCSQWLEDRVTIFFFFFFFTKKSQYNSAVHINIEYTILIMFNSVCDANMRQSE